MRSVSLVLFFFNDTATTEIYTLSLHDALPISRAAASSAGRRARPTPALARRARSLHCSLPRCWRTARSSSLRAPPPARSEEHTSELQSQSNLVCRLLLEKKNKKKYK